MSLPPLRIVCFGLSLTSSWGNGHATTYRSLIGALAARGHDILFVERDVPWYRDNRDLPSPGYARVALYPSLEELPQFAAAVEGADLVVVGSFTPDGREVGEFVLAHARGMTAFYDIDTPVTLSQLEDDSCPYLSRAQIPRYALYLSFTGGPTLTRLERDFGSPMARPLYCSVNTEHYKPIDVAKRWDLGYLGTYSRDRQRSLEQRLLEPAAAWPAGRFIVAGPQFPDSIIWPKNVERVEHLAPGTHAEFYNAQRYTLNVTRSAMVSAGFSPSVRLFEAAACATPIISDPWEGLHEFFRAGEEILVTHSSAETLEILQTLSPQQARQIGERARACVLSRHTAEHRALELESFVGERRRQQVA